MTKLLFIPSPLLEESPTSMLKRMAVKHGCGNYADLQGILGRTNIFASLLCRSHPVIQSIARRAGAAEEDFLSGFYEPVAARRDIPPLKINGISVNSDIIRKRGAAFCSDCWAEGHERYIKDLKLCSYCPYHFKKYLFKCPKCQLKMHWHTPFEAQCRCDHILISPPCTSDEVKIEQKLLCIFRTEASDDFSSFMKHLNGLGYRLESPAQCPANRCLMSMAFALLEKDIPSLLACLRNLSALYPEIPKRIIAAKLSLFNDVKVQRCAREFVNDKACCALPEGAAVDRIPIHQFSLTRSQILGWLKLTEQNWTKLRNMMNTLAEKGRYDWRLAQKISEKVVSIRLQNGFRKKKILINGLSKKDLQKKLQISAKVISDAVKEKILILKKGQRRKYFSESDIDKFSDNYISTNRLSSQTGIPLLQIRKAIKHLGIISLNFKSQVLRHSLIGTQTTQLVIEWCKSNVPRTPKKQRCPSPMLEHYTTKSPEHWLPTTAAATYLKVCVRVIRQLIKSRILADVQRKGLGGGYCISIKELDSFKSRYMGATEARKLLGCRRAMTTKTLHRIGIKPCAGPSVDDNPSTFYLRGEILAYISARERLVSEEKIGYTRLEACKKLQLHRCTIPVLLKKEVLHHVNLKRGGCDLIKYSDVDTFYDRYAKLTTIGQWLKISKFCVRRLLAYFSIIPICGAPLDTAPDYLFSIDEIAQHFPIPTGKKYSNRSRYRNIPFANITELMKKYEVSAISFGTLFLNSGFTKPIQLGPTRYLLNQDIFKVEKILKKYYTIPQADSYLGEKQITRRLLKLRELVASYPLKAYYKHPMIKKSVLQDYAAQHGYL
ncbi:TniQ family protein [Pseudomonas synxantha]|uniref:Biotin operon repressor n=1 Tax=Pseudomonas synxantha TaxID=47883 RepID=A0ACC6JLN9_9PSED|nr:TniQ family protein [Pseudomonas synxantha]MDR6607447.1 biotin operon repressor [Pseudomonas synxantha]